MATKNQKSPDTSDKKSKKKATNKPDKNYSLIRAIRKSPQYRNNVIRRDITSRKYIRENCTVTGPGKIVPGQLVSFNYFTPKTEKELEYYDARPVTIFFGVVKTEDGPRILGFNIHYYPPRIRYQVLDRIMEIWKPMYMKVWEQGLTADLSYFDYRWLLQQLENAGLEFGVRMYIPGLTGAVRVIPPKDWEKAVFTEGDFRKKTRELILKYWADYINKKRNKQ